MSENKLKQLKVAELKEILAKANIVPGKANKAELIAKILASQQALDAYNELHSSPANTPQETPNVTTSNKPQSTAVAPTPAAKVTPASDTPKTHSTPTPAPAAVTVPALAPSAPSSSVPAPAPAPASEPEPAAAAPETTAPEDEELAKRKARAARFNIPLVETLKPAPSKSTKAQAAKATPKAPASEDPEKLAARAKRFGLPAQSATTPAAAAKPAPAKPAPAAATAKDSAKPARGNKRAANEPLTEEELERRRKRAERFGLPINGAKA